MADQDDQVKCPFCGSADCFHRGNMMATVIEKDAPDAPPQEIETRLFSCMTCGAVFNELETWD